MSSQQRQGPSAGTEWEALLPSSQADTLANNNASSNHQPTTGPPRRPLPPQRLESSSPVPSTRAMGSLFKTLYSGRWFPGAWDIRDVPHPNNLNEHHHDDNDGDMEHSSHRRRSSKSRRQRTTITGSPGPSSSASLSSTIRIRQGRSWRRRIFLLVTEPDTSILSALFFVALIVAIMVMNGLMMLQTMQFLQYTPTTCDFCQVEWPQQHQYDINSVDDGVSSSWIRDASSNIPATDDATDNRHMGIPCICPPTPYPWTERVLKYLVYFFSIEWILRVICYSPAPHEQEDQDTPLGRRRSHQDRRRPLAPRLGQFLNYLFSWQQILDFWATFPYYMEFLGNSNGLMSLRLLRLFRVFQLVRLGTYNATLTTLLTVLQQATLHLKLLVLILLFGAALFGSVIYWLERGDWKYWPETESFQFIRTNEHGQEEVSPFTSIPATFYWFMVTATTVGYGDVYPTSNVGRWVGVMAMLSGVLVVAFPVGVFSDLWSKELTKKGAWQSDNYEDDEDDDGDGDNEDNGDDGENRRLVAPITNIPSNRYRTMEEERKAAQSVHSNTAPTLPQEQQQQQQQQQQGTWLDSFFSGTAQSAGVILSRANVDTIMAHLQSIQESQRVIQHILAQAQTQATQHE